ncbi:hypothetical protein GUJ93_ZPchr0019g2663 [Zizania palustris]|uniref:Uncharacterized protein n=1 Tax=Zizania palustris TaxID=103762 RepID=A0A8J5SUG3_ZIZPA|nr:hypothetical protein GUJ93_ZPchr0019g2663 [Zizania palustris]
MAAATAAAAHERQPGADGWKGAASACVSWFQGKEKGKRVLENDAVTLLGSQEVVAVKKRNLGKVDSGKGDRGDCNSRNSTAEDFWL